MTTLLADIVDNSCTDKNTTHCYLEIYEQLMSTKKDTARNILEVGIERGGSIKLWRDYFTNATIYGVDVIDINMPHINNYIKNDERIILHTSVDAYSEEFFKREFLDKGIKCDFVIDDGPHSIDSMCTFIDLYSQILTDDGVLIIEDVQAWEWVKILERYTPDHLRKYIQTHDLRNVKGRYDDILFIINKNDNH